MSDSSSTSSTASPEEVARFAAMADTWWDPNGKFKPLHQLNPPRVDYILNYVCEHYDRDPETDKPLSGLSLIDIGCGGGLLCEPLTKLGATVTGIDAGEKGLGVARLHAEQEGLDIDYRHVLPEDMVDETSRYDIVLCMEVIEHVSDVDQFLRTASGLAKPGGAMFLSTINRTVKSLALAKFGAEYILRWLPIGTHDWDKFVKPSELATSLRKENVEILDIKGVVYNLLTGEWSTGKNLDMNYMAYGVRAKN